MTMSNRYHQQRGAAMVEFALVSVVFLGMLFGMIEFAVAYTINDNIAFGAAQGARYAMVNGSTAPKPALDSDIQDYVRSKMDNLDNAKAVIVVTHYDATGAVSPLCNKPVACEVGVTVTYPFQIGLTLPVVNRTVTLRGESRMPIAQ